MDVFSSYYATFKNRRSDSIDRREQKIDLINHGLDLMNNINKTIISLMRQMNDRQKALEDHFYKLKKKKKISIRDSNSSLQESMPNKVCASSNSYSNKHYY